MPRLISCAMTVDAVLDRTKTVTRRKGWWLDGRGRRLVVPGEAVTQAENIRRSNAPTIVRWRSNTCVRGHSLEDAYPIRRNGKAVGRLCRTCTREKNARRHKERQAKAAWSYLDAADGVTP